jgi:hypothetical protein
LLPEGGLGDAGGVYAGRKLVDGEVAPRRPSTREGKRERHGSDGDRLDRAVIEGTPVRGEA